MIILPAIDIKDGACVRLYKGDFSTVHKVAENAVDTAKSFAEQGAKWLHMVDLDGAKDGERKNSKVILDVRKNTSLHIEVGGGIRDMAYRQSYSWFCGCQKSRACKRSYKGIRRKDCRRD